MGTTPPPSHIKPLPGNPEGKLKAGVSVRGSRFRWETIRIANQRVHDADYPAAWTGIINHPNRNKSFPKGQVTETTLTKFNFNSEGIKGSENGQERHYGDRRDGLIKVETGPVVFAPYYEAPAS